MEAPHADLPDLILLDIIMPEPDGFEVARQLKKMESTEDIPIIFLTSLDDTKSRVKAFENGGIDYVSKPFRKDELIAHINAHLQLKQVNEELALVDIRIRNLNNELEKAKTEQERLNDQKNQFLAVITRDESLTFV
jgi:DNA-binding response OmpR family regulator